ncbi:MAG: hypothetical protein AAF297_00100 [Planctomycetota bacterium]
MSDEGTKPNPNPSPDTTPPQSEAAAGNPKLSKKFAGPTKTVLNRTWLIKVVVMTLALFAFGSWGLYDAIAAYPKRGEGFASHAKLEYLRAAQTADQEEERGVLRREASVPDPVAELANLREVEDDLQTQASNQNDPRYYRAQMQLRRLDWLVGLQRIGQLLPERTAIESPRDDLMALEERWKTESPPAALAAYDIPSQWAIMVVCYGFTAYLLFLFITVATKSYRWDPAAQRLTFPSGKSIVPGDLSEVDKRKWDKFIVYLSIKDSHDTLGGQAVKVDTYRYALLEDWILDMEEAAFGSEEADESAGPGDSDEAQADAPAGESKATAG